MVLYQIISTIRELPAHIPKCRAWKKQYYSWCWFIASWIDQMAEFKVHVEEIAKISSRIRRVKI